MDLLAPISSLVVKQLKEWGEILTGIETRNRYDISDTSGNVVMRSGEESSFLARYFLKRIRPLTMHIVTPQGQPEILLRRPFRFYFHEMTVSDSNGLPVGVVRRRFAIFSRPFSVYDSLGREIFSVIGPMLHPWTFRILVNGMEVGLILKKWSGLGKEMFTDADTFSIQFPDGIDAKQKALLLGALFLIDLLHFER